MDVNAKKLTILLAVLNVVAILTLIGVGFLIFDDGEAVVTPTPAPVVVVEETAVPVVEVTPTVEATATPRPVATATPITVESE